MKIKINVFFSNLSIILLVFVIASRGIVPNIIYEGYIWCLGGWFFLKGDWYFLLKKINVHKWILFYILSFLIFSISVVIAQNISSLKIFYNYLQFIPFLLIFSQIRRVRMFVLYSAIYLLFIAICLILHKLSFINFEELYYIRGIERASGLMGNPNYFAYFCFCIFILVNCLFRGKQLFIFSFFILICIVLSMSRGILLAICVFWFLYTVTSIKKLIIATFLSFFIIINISYIENNIFSEQLIHRVEKIKDGGGSGRTIIWKDGYVVWSNNIQSILFGLGFNQFEDKAKYLGIHNTVHNSYLRILYEFGIIGFIVLFGFYYTIILGIRWNNLKTAVIVSSSIGFCWLTNDFFIVKETFFLMSTLLLLPKVKV